jgi:hypothetical protein
MELTWQLFTSKVSLYGLVRNSRNARNLLTNALTTLSFRQWNRELFVFESKTLYFSYIVTYACDERRMSESENSLRIFDVFTGECKKSFSPSHQGSGIVLSWPFFKWSYDEQYFGFCRSKGNNIFIYDTATFTINQNKPIELEGLVTFDWNPSKNLIAYYCEERVSPKCLFHVHIFSHHRMRQPRLASSIFHRVKRSGHSVFSPSQLQICFGKRLVTIWLHTPNVTMLFVRQKKAVRS